MSRIYLAVFAGVAGVLGATSITASVQANDNGHAKESIEVAYEDLKLKFQSVDPSTNPATPLQNIDLSLHDARIGTLQNPGSTLPSSSSLGIVNPDPIGLGDAGLFGVFYSGAPGDFPANSFFDVFTEITDPNTGQPAEMKNGVVKFFNESKGFGMVVSGHVPGEPEYFYSLTGQINPAQVGLSFANVPVIPGGGGSFFDIFTELRFDGLGTINPNLPLFEITLTPVPEPSTIVLAGAGAAALLAVARKRRLLSV